MKNKIALIRKKRLKSLGVFLFFGIFTLRMNQKKHQSLQIQGKDKELLKKIKQAIACGELSFASVGLVFDDIGFASEKDFAPELKNNVQKFLGDENLNVDNLSFAHLSEKEKNTQAELSTNIKFQEDFFRDVEKREVELSFDNKELLKTFSSYLAMCIIPNLEKYRPLILSKKLVETYLHSGEIKENPRLISGALSATFYDFQKKYTRVYLAEFEAFEKEVRQCWGQKPTLAQTISALQVLDELPELGSPAAPKSQAALDQFLKLYPLSDLSLVDRESRLRKNPIVENFVLGSPRPFQDFLKIEKQITRSLEKKLASVQAFLTQKIINQSHTTEAQKLLDLIQASQMSELVTLLSSKQKDALVRTIRLLCLDSSDNV